MAFKAKGDLVRALADLSKAVDEDKRIVNSFGKFFGSKQDPEIFAKRGSVYQAKGQIELAIAYQ